METLQNLCDIANGKHRRFHNVSREASVQFKRWLADYQAAATLEEVFKQWEGMDAVTDDYLRVRLRCEGKRGVIEFASPRAPWEDHGQSKEPHLNDELLYLILSLVTTPGCDCLRVCPECEKCYVAGRGNQKYCGADCDCGGGCGRRVASRNKVADNYDKLRNRRITACKAAYEKYLVSNSPPQNSEGYRRAAEYILNEANKRLRPDFRLGGSGSGPEGKKLRVNFITQNAKEIGIPKGAK